MYISPDILHVKFTLRRTVTLAVGCIESRTRKLASSRDGVPSAATRPLVSLTTTSAFLGMGSHACEVSMRVNPSRQTHGQVSVLYGSPAPEYSAFAGSCTVHGLHRPSWSSEQGVRYIPMGQRDLVQLRQVPEASFHLSSVHVVQEGTSFVSQVPSV